MEQEDSSKDNPENKVISIYSWSLLSCYCPLNFPQFPVFISELWTPSFCSSFSCHALHFIIKCSNFKIGSEASKLTPEAGGQRLFFLNIHFLNSSSASKRFKVPLNLEVLIKLSFSILPVFPKPSILPMKYSCLI